MDHPIASHNSTPVVVARAGFEPPLIVEASEVYFAFESGRWTYDCAACGAQCCRGFGYSLRAGKELEAHVARSRTVSLFLAPTTDSLPSSCYAVRNFPPGCVMLRKGGLCDIQHVYGYSAKPEMCRQFPFSAVKLVEQCLIVAPHFGLCPLEVSLQLADASSHRRVLAEMQAGCLSTEVVEAGCVHQDVHEALAVEKVIRDLSGSNLNVATYDDFVLAQIRATMELVRESDRASEDPSFGSRDHLNLFCERLRAVIGMWPTREYDRANDVIRTMVAATPIIRSHLVFPHRFTRLEPRSLPLARVPYVLLVLQKLLALAHEAGMATVTYQTAMALLDTYRAFLYVGALIDRQMAWATTARIELARHRREPAAVYRSYIRTAKALVGRDPRPMGDLLKETCVDGPIGRLSVLDGVCRRIVTCVVPDGSRRRRAGWSCPSIKKFVLRAMPVDVLCEMAAKWSRGQVIGRVGSWKGRTS